MSTAGAKGDVGHLRFPMSPLDTPLTFRWPLSEAFAAKRGRRGLGSVRRAGSGTLLCPEVTLRKPPRITVRGHTMQGANAVAAKSSASIKGCTLGAPNTPVGPSHLDARPKGVASKGKVGESRGAGKPWCPCPFCPPPWARHPRLPKAANVHAHLERKVASSGCAAVSAKPFTLC